MGDENPLEFIPTRDMLEELKRRFRTMLFCGIADTTCDGERGWVTIMQGGDVHASVGLAQHAAMRMLSDIDIAGDEDEDEE